MHRAIIFRNASTAQRPAVRTIALTDLAKSHKTKVCTRASPLASQPPIESAKGGPCFWFNRLCKPQTPEPNDTRTTLEHFYISGTLTTCKSSIEVIILKRREPQAARLKSTFSRINNPKLDVQCRLHMPTTRHQIAPQFNQQAPTKFAKLFHQASSNSKTDRNWRCTVREDILLDDNHWQVFRQNSLANTRHSDQILGRFKTTTRLSISNNSRSNYRA